MWRKGNSHFFPLSDNYDAEAVLSHHYIKHHHKNKTGGKAHSA